MTQGSRDTIVRGGLEAGCDAAFGAPFRLTGAWSLNGDAFSFTSAAGTVCGVDFKGGGAYGLAGREAGILRGGVSAVVRDWVALSGAVGMPLNGHDTKLDLRFSGDGKGDGKGGGQDVRAAFSAATLGVAGVKVRDVAASASGEDVMRAATFEARLRTGEGGLGDMAWSGAEGRLTGGPGGAAFSLRTRGDIVAQVAGDYAAGKGEVLLRTLALERPAAGVGMRLASPVRIGGGQRASAGGVNVEGADFVFLPHGGARVDVTRFPGSMDAEVELHDVPLQLVRLFTDATQVQGRIAGGARVHGEGGRARGDVRLDLEDVRLPDGGPAVAARLTGRLEPADADLSFLDGRVTLEGVGADDAVAEFSLPLRGVATGTPAMSGPDPVRGHVRWRGDVAPLWRFVPLPDRRLAGRGDVEVTVDGTVDAPRVSSRAFLCGGRYEDLVTGILLTDVTLESHRSPGGSLRCVLSASDGRGGRVALEGTLETVADVALPASGAVSRGRAVPVLSTSAGDVGRPAARGATAGDPTSKREGATRAGRVDGATTGAAVPLPSGSLGPTGTEQGDDAGPLRPLSSGEQVVFRHAAPDGGALAPLPGPRIMLRGVLQSLRPFRRDDMDMTLSGPVELIGPLQAPTLRADLMVERAVLEIVSGLGGSVRTLEVQERGGLPPAGGAHATGQRAGAPALSSLVLDMRVRAANRLFIRGRGLDSEWQGRFDIKGTAARPSLYGALSPVRGRFSLLGKPFVFTQGTISFMGAVPPDPDLDLELSHAGNAVTAFIHVGGRASFPSLTFESRPALPQDEVMAHVLFDKSASELSRFEALQAANAMRVMAGVGKAGLDPLMSLQQKLGIDVLLLGDGRSTQGTARITPTTERGLAPSARQAQTPAVPEGPSVEAGKYVMDNVYVGVQQGTDPGSLGVRIEVELLPRVNLEGHGSSSSSDIGIMWKKDY